MCSVVPEADGGICTQLAVAAGSSTTPSPTARLTIAGEVQETLVGGITGPLLGALLQAARMANPTAEVFVTAVILTGRLLIDMDANTKRKIRCCNDF
jgi:hypothetical protein